MADGELAERLEMLLVMQWLDEDAPEDGVVSLSVATAAAELGLPPGRAGLLGVMAGLGDLESRGAVAVAWPGGGRGPEGRVTLSETLRRDARGLFGRD
jgi:hypothetical protein